ncbi:HEAT repeat domain-containing protein [candidate division TA06 bacterium]|uniref:HEAT repeat domain-containing protein n=1 Tax=candidate division TA06 bacterium TaxID=2250710 RepID=A0A523UNX7_UNCT6|nr:MAG: HEAT repeat domain-containing protein [candidate division TA06 bacterium]
MADSANVMTTLEVEEEKVEALELDTAEKLLLSLSRAITNMRFYLPNSPLVRSSKIEFYEEMTDFLKRWDRMSFEVTDEALTYKGNPVYQIDEKANSFAFIFYRDGVRRITFHEGLSSEEVNTFLDIICEAVKSSEEEADIVSLLWSGNFINIDYVAIQAFMESEGGVQGPEEVEETLVPVGNEPLVEGNVEDLREQSGIVITGALRSGPTTAGGVSYGSSAAVLAQSTALAQSQALKAEMEKTNRQFFDTVTPEEIRERIQVLARFSAMERYGDLLLDLLSLEDDISERAHLLNLVLDHVKGLALQQKFDLASETTQKIKQMLKDPAFQKGHFHEMLSSFMEKIVSAVHSGGMKKKIKGAFPKDPRGVLNFLQFVGPSAIPILIELVSVAKDAEGRAALRDVLSALAVRDLAKLSKAVSSHDPRVAREIVTIIGRIADPKGVRMLKSCLKHYHPSVRIEAVRSLGQIGTPDSTKLILEFLKDPDTDVRILAIKTLDAPNEKFLRRIIRDMVASRNFRIRPMVEKVALIDALKRSRSDDVVSAFTGFFRTAWWFRRKEDDSIMMAIIAALASIGTGTAKKLLEQGTKSRRKTVAVESFRALQHFEE